MDEFGYLPFEPAAAHLLFQLVSRRYERGSILITSNRAVGDWGTVLGDQVVATAILDRLLHHSHVLTIRGAPPLVSPMKATPAFSRSSYGPRPAAVRTALPAVGLRRRRIGRTPGG